MSDRYITLRYRSPSPEPLIIERRPRRYTRSPSPVRRRELSRPRRVSFGVATDPRSRKTVIFKESTYRRQRLSGRRSRTPSPPPSPPSPFRRGYIMSDKHGDTYVPLPKELPKKDDRGSSPDEDEKKRRRQEKGKSRVVFHPDDPDYYPVVETPSTTSSERRDSGVFSGGGSPRNAKYYDTKGRALTFPERRTAGDEVAVQDLTRQFNSIITNERFDKLEAEARANHLQEKLNKAQAEIEQNKRASWVEERERRVAEREKNWEHQRQSSSGSRERPRRRDVIVTQDRPPIRTDEDVAAASALASARSDLKKKQRDSRDFGPR